MESVSNFCKRYKSTTTLSENGLLLIQLMNALKYLQACGIEDVSLDEMLVCKRESDAESKLMLPPMTVDCIGAIEKVSRQIEWRSFHCFIIPRPTSMENICLFYSKLANFLWLLIGLLPPPFTEIE